MPTHDELTAKEAFGGPWTQEAEYVPPGSGDRLACRVIIDREAERVMERGNYSYLSRQTEASFLLEEVSTDAGGLIVVEGDDWWSLGDIVEDDGLIRVHAIRPTVEPEDPEEPDP